MRMFSLRGENNGWMESVRCSSLSVADIHILITLSLPVVPRQQKYTVTTKLCSTSTSYPSYVVNRERLGANFFPKF